MDKEPISNSEQLDLLRRKLLEERQQIERGAEERREAEESEEREQEALAQAVQERAQERLSAIDEALERMEGDEFGLCDRCGEEISRARLAADPTVRLCIDCAETLQH